MQNTLLIDGNSLGHFANNGARLSIGALEVQAIYNFLRILRQTVAIYSAYQPIVLWDGASWRKLMFPDYKAGRDREETKHEIALKAQKDSYKRQSPYIAKALEMLGVPQVRALNMEADDLGAILCDRYAQRGKVVLYTGDRDWLQLVGPNVTWMDFANKRKVTIDNFEEMTGVKTARQFVEVKALAGDAGDSVPGVGGVGEKGAIEFIKTYGSFKDFLNMVVLEKSVDFAKLPKKFKALVEDETKAIIFDRNIDLMDLRSPARPAAQNLTITKGMPDAVKFQSFCDLLLFKSITQELDEWLRVFPAFRDLATASS